MAAQRVVVRLEQHHPALRRIDPSTAFLYAPHTISCLLLGGFPQLALRLAVVIDVLEPHLHAAGLALLAYYGDVFSRSASSTPAKTANAEAGLWAATLVFLGYSVVQGPRTSMVRPHPAVWRFVHGVSVVYVLGLVWLLFQTVEDARAGLKHLFPSLGVEVQYRDYGTSCALIDSSQPLGVSWSTIRSTVFDEFVVAHSLGWWAKALLLRNYTLLWAYSIGFELMEVTFRHMLPNFKECWWDSWVLDVALCNCLGIYTGMATVRCLECRYTNYNWQGLSELSSFGQKARRSMAQLLPYSWTKLNWMVFSSPKRCLQSAVVVAACLAVELNVFFLKYALWIPPTNPLNTARLVLWVLVGAPGIREYYEFIQGTTDTEAVAFTGGTRFAKLGTFAWLAIAMIALETMISVKFGRGLYKEPWPRWVLVTWAVAVALITALMMLWQYCRVKQHHDSTVSALTHKELSAVEGKGEKDN